MKKIISIFALSVFASYAMAQGAQDVYRFSQSNFSTITARSAGMGGAFVSLGADASSMSTNPAGLGMYTKSEVAITPVLGFGRMNTSVSGGESMRRHDTHFGLNNFSAVFAGRGFAIGVGSNRLTDFNSRYASQGGASGKSLSDMFARQLDGIPSSSIGSPEGDEYRAFYKYGPDMWGAILGYQTFLVEPDGGGASYSTAPSLYDGDLVVPMQSVSTYGGIDEINISTAGNYNDIVYYGVSFGIQTINYKEVNSYSEITPVGADGEALNHGDLDNFTYNQTLVSRGTGFNIKLGVTVRPLDWLRVGVAYHTPTWTVMSEQYGADITNYRFGYRDPVWADSPILDNEYSMSSPSRFMAGVSFVVARRLILSADYERVWYDAMKFRTPDLRGQNSVISDIYRGVNNVRLGAEYQPVSRVFVRAGYAYRSSAYRDPMLRDFDMGSQYSAGVGYRSRHFSIDAAYVYGGNSYRPYAYYEGSDGVVSRSGHRSTVLLSVAVRF